MVDLIERHIMQDYLPEALSYCTNCPGLLPIAVFILFLLTGVWRDCLIQVLELEFYIKLGVYS
jgi:hypothetical protein